MKRVSITYAMYFQNKHKHVGTLFQGKFKNTVVDTDRQLVYLSKYILLNPVKLIKNLDNYSFSSFRVYVNKTEVPEWLHPEYVLKLQKKYKEFIEAPVDDKEASVLEKIVLE